MMEPHIAKIWLPIWHIWSADPIAALVIVPLILWEEWEAMRGKACGYCPFG